MKKWVVFVSVWVTWALVITATNSWPEVVKSWFIAPTMLLGSIIAGATAEGGGAVAFPVLTLVFDVCPRVARDFSLMIQSVGMTAASFAIVAMGLKVEWRAICWACLGGFVGTILGIDVIAPALPPSYMKMFFVSFWLAFVIVLFSLNRHQQRIVKVSIEGFHIVHAIQLMAIGLLGGIVSGMTGCGLDITTFSLLVLGFRVSEAVSTRSSVIMMAAASVFGFAYKGSTVGMEPDAWNYWYTAVPVVIFGAPLGAYLVRKKSRKFLAGILYCTISIQFVTALIVIPQTTRLLGFSLVSCAIGVAVFGGILLIGRSQSPTTDDNVATANP